MSILLVMTDGVDAELTAYLLSQINDHVVTVGTLVDARRSLAERLWSVVVLDTELPDGSGFELLHNLADGRAGGGILVLSASTELLHKVRALEEGADDYLVRPYEPAELLARVKALLRRFRQRDANPDGSVVRVGRVELDVNQLVVTLPGNRRERLTPNEMRLLHYLMTHSQRVVEHGELLARLFGAEYQSTTSNAIGVYMRRVRRKIEANPDRPRYIVTVRGSGYRFQADAEREPSQRPSRRRLVRRRGRG